MDKTKIFKGVAFINFIGFIILFLLFKNGTFDKYFSNDKSSSLTSPNGGTPTKLTKDSINQKNDSLKRRRLSSSKSLVIIDDLFQEGATIKAAKDSIKLSAIEDKKHLKESSKSGLIINSKKGKTDSLKSKERDQKKTKGQ